jgi:Mg-chelatase subunit ChlD
MACAFIAILACSPTGDTLGASSRASKESGGSGGSAPGAGGGAGGTSSGFGGSGFSLEPGSSRTNEQDAACAAESQQAERLVIETEITHEVEITEAEPVALYFMLDQSGSMLGSKWNSARTAIHSFLSDPRSNGLDVALQLFSVSFFPPSGCGNCNGSDCAVPLVPITRLPGNTQPFLDVLNREPIGIGTPIEAGLRGGILFCTQFKQQHPDEDCVVVLITDGEPSTCATGVDLANIAGQAYANNGIQTFAIGMDGADFVLMDMIAEQGGTDCVDPVGSPPYACNVQTTDFLAVLERIRETVTHIETRTEVVTEIQETALECEFNVPTPPPGERFDKDQVNVRFSASGRAAETIFQVPVVQDCAAAGGGWYYDDVQNPSKILLCDQTCAVVQSTSEARIDILLGCATQVAPVR